MFSFGLKSHATHLSPDKTASQLCSPNPSLSVIRDAGMVVQFGWTAAADPSSCVVISTFCLHI